MFNESEAIENLVDNGIINNTCNWGCSNSYLTGEKYSPRFDADHPYVLPNRTFHFQINDKTYHEDI